jgi:hypothetical protein
MVLKMCAFDDLYQSFVSHVTTGRDDDELVSDVSERYHENCAAMMWKMTHLVATTEAQLEWKIAMWEDARDCEIGLAALEPLFSSINDDWTQMRKRRHG